MIISLVLLYILIGFVIGYFGYSFDYKNGVELEPSAVALVVFLWPIVAIPLAPYIIITTVHKRLNKPKV